MFKPTVNFPRKVSFSWPSPNGVGFKKEIITATFKRLSLPEMEALNESIEANLPNGDDEEGQQQTKWLRRIRGALDEILLKVEGVELTTDAGDPLPAEDILEWCKDDATISVAMYEDYQRAIAGRELEKGNSQAPR